MALDCSLIAISQGVTHKKISTCQNVETLYSSKQIATKLEENIAKVY